jgi:AbiV family abortive infection protein
MPKIRYGPVLAHDKLHDGYAKAVEQGSALLQAGMDLVSTQPAIALGLAELGQEEIGKSLSLLAAISLPCDPDSWTWFWGSWTNHRLKAHRAFLYELISPTRIEMRTADGMQLAGFTLRREIQHEKEAAFYVNFDNKTGSFLSPADGVPPLEAQHRVATLLYLAVTAHRVYAALHATAALRSYELFSEVAFRICSEDLYQQQMPALLLEFASRSPAHAEIVSVLDDSLASGRKYIEEIFGRHQGSHDLKDA